MTQPRKRPLILNVDDNEIGRYSVTRNLERTGYDVVDAATGSEALQLADTHHPDLVLLDVQLPDMDGFEVCRRLKSGALTAGIPVLHLSASYLDDVSRVKGLNSGADGYLTEPVDPAVLNATMKALLRMKQAERAERNAASQWQSTFDAIADGVAVLDAEGRVLRTNRALAAITGRLPEDLIGASWSELFPAKPAGCAAESSHYGRMLRISCDPIRTESGVISGSVAIASDITEWYNLQETLKHSQKLESIGLLAGGVAHDFNNLLTGIIGNATLALDGAPESIGRYLRNVVQAGEHAADLARQLLAYAGKGQFVIGATDISALVRELVPLVQAGIPRKVKIALELDAGVPPVEGDAAQLRQLLMNLVINGAEAIGDAAGVVRVRVRSHESGRLVAIEVSDNGCGMDVDTQAKIFDPFFTTKFMGRGLGLAAAHGIVRQHRGTIRVESAPGGGTTFEVLLPASASTVRPPRKEAVAPAPPTSATILVVDDEEVVRNYTQTALQKFGYQVMIAANGAEGVEVFRRSGSELSLVLLDLTMPVMGGEEALSQILRLRADTKVLIVSGYDETDVIRRVGKSRIVGFLQKPYSTVRLGQKVREILA